MNDQPMLADVPTPIAYVEPEPMTFSRYKELTALAWATKEFIASREIEFKNGEACLFGRMMQEIIYLK
jgi:hypothetical protein